MKKQTLLGFLLLTAISLPCTAQQNKKENLYEEPGVSLKLAQYRKGLISKILYTVSLDIPSNTRLPIHATEEITFEISAVDSIALDFKESKDRLSTVFVNSKEAAIIYKNEHIVIPAGYLVKGLNKIVIEFVAGDLSLNRSDEFMYTLFVPDRARTFMPCFDQPDLKACFRLILNIPQEWSAVSNGGIMNTLDSADKKRVYFNTSDMISTYLFSFAAGKFQKASKTVDGRQMNFYYRETDKDKINPSLDAVFDLHAQAIKFMETYSGINYPFQKFDVVAIPDFQFGGMEHVGAVYYRSDILFLNASATLTQKMERLGTIAHETAHMWFGNLVTMKWFNDVWMKEVFANFMANKIMDMLTRDRNRDLRFLLNHHPYAYSIDRTTGSNPIRQELENLDQAGSLYGNIIYNKAPIVLRQLEKITGEKDFQEAARQYLKRYAYGNAEWTDVVSILDSISSADISTWNEQWINTAGRPVLNYELRLKQDTISELIITQKPEYDIPGSWTQHFNLGLIYEYGQRTIPVFMDDKSVEVKSVQNLPAPLFLLFNEDGEGYGSFPVDQKMLNHFSLLEEPVKRASAIINLYENVLNGETMTPEQLLRFYASRFKEEKEDLIIYRMVHQFRNLYWQYISMPVRQEISEELENKVWNAVKDAHTITKRRLLFQTYISITLSRKGIDRLYKIWKTGKVVKHMKLSEDDYMHIAGELALKKHPRSISILNTQLEKIKDKDRQNRFKFLMPSLIGNREELDSVFASFYQKKNRKNEVWVAMALGYLNHPLRSPGSEKYLPATLDLLEQIQMTGGVFFPSAWLNATFGNYQSTSAVNIVKTFLVQHIGYNQNLKRKILQETDDLFRAEKLLAHQK